MYQMEAKSVVGNALGAADEPTLPPAKKSDEARLAQRLTPIQRFVAKLPDVEKATAAVMADTSKTPQERVYAAARQNVKGLLEAAKSAGLGEFDSVEGLHKHLLQKENVLLVPSFDLQARPPAIAIEVAKVKRESLTAEEGGRLLSAFTKLTGIPAPGAQTIYIQEEMLYDQNPDRGMSDNYGTSSTPLEGESFILINRASIKSTKETYQGTAADKEKAVTANELVAVAFNGEYPKLMHSPNKPLYLYNELQPIAPIHVLELGSDYAALSVGEDIGDVIKRMSGNNPSYELCNIAVAEMFLSLFQKSPAQRAEFEKYMAEAPPKNEPVYYAAMKFLKVHPELKDVLKTEMTAKMEKMLLSAKAILDKAEANLP